MPSDGGLRVAAAAGVAGFGGGGGLTSGRRSFDLADDNGGGAALNSFSVSIEGLLSPLFSAVDIAPQDDVHHSLTFVARGGSTTLSLGGYNDLGYVQLDAVAVTVAAVPEPASWLLLAGGTGLLALRRRRVR